MGLVHDVGVANTSFAEGTLRLAIACSGAAT